MNYFRGFFFLKKNAAIFLFFIDRSIRTAILSAIQFASTMQLLAPRVSSPKNSVLRNKASILINCKISTESGIEITRPE